MYQDEYMKKGGESSVDIQGIVPLNTQKTRLSSFQKKKRTKAAITSPANEGRIVAAEAFSLLLLLLTTGLHKEVMAVVALVLKLAWSLT